MSQRGAAAVAATVSDELIDAALRGPVIVCFGLDGRTQAGSRVEAFQDAAREGAILLNLSQLAHDVRRRAAN